MAPTVHCDITVNIPLHPITWKMFDITSPSTPCHFHRTYNLFVICEFNEEISWVFPITQIFGESEKSFEELEPFFQDLWVTNKEF